MQAARNEALGKLRQGCGRGMVRAGERAYVHDGHSADVPLVERLVERLGAVEHALPPPHKDREGTRW